MPYRNKTYVCFDGDSDMHYYRLMQAWHQSDRSTFTFYNAHDLNSARDTSMEESIKRQLRTRLLNAKVFVVLIGIQTRYLYKFVRWEMEQAIALNLPIIAVNLNGLRKQDLEKCPLIIRNELAVHISFNTRILEYALENWTILHYQHKKQGERGPFYYDLAIYQSLRL